MELKIPFRRKNRKGMEAKQDYKPDSGLFFFRFIFLTGGFPFGDFLIDCR